MQTDLHYRLTRFNISPGKDASLYIEKKMVGKSHVNEVSVPFGSSIFESVKHHYIDIKTLSRVQPQKDYTSLPTLTPSISSGGVVDALSTYSNSETAN